MKIESSGARDCMWIDDRSVSVAFVKFPVRSKKVKWISN